MKKHNKEDKLLLKGLCDEEDINIFYKWKQKKYNDTSLVLLSYNDYRELVKEANIKAFDIGKIKGKYQLARYNDEGNYIKGNCRFITKEENSKERKITDKQREANRTCGKKVGLLPKTESQKDNARKAGKVAHSLPRTEKQIKVCKENGKKLNECLKLRRKVI
jgi:hypothetical protein